MVPGMRFVALIVGLGFIYGALRGFRGYLPSKTDRGKWPLVQGRIVDVHEPPDPDLHVTNRPRVTFRTVDGVEVDAWARNQTYDIRRRVGGRIDVRYNPDNPQDFWVDAGPDAMKPIGRLLGALILLLFLAIGVGLVVFNLG
jgi:hypothetical protein